MPVELFELRDMVRRRIGDTETPFVFDDDIIDGYISDAILSVEADWSRGIFLDGVDFSQPIEKMDAMLFSVKAHYLIKLRTKDKADRDNFLMKKGRLTLDNTGQSSDHKDTLEMIEKEYSRLLYRLKHGGSIRGVRME
jgi:hypothetical protein